MNMRLKGPATVAVALLMITGAVAAQTVTAEAPATPKATGKASSSYYPATPEPLSTKPVSVSTLIKGIRVQGNSVVATDRILNAVLSRAGDVLSKEKIKEDVSSIYAMGYFSDVVVGFEKAKDGTVIIYKVKENPVLNGIVIIGNTVYSTAEILATFESKVGYTLSYKAIQDDVKALDSKYHADGYILERVVDVTTDPATNILTIRLIEGQIESISIVGNNNTKDYVILREMKSTAGTVLNEKVLGKDLKRLFNLGFFSDVSPNFEPTSSPDKVGLVVNVKESKTNTINFGGGYGEREGWFGFVDLSAENLFGTGQGVLLRGQAGQQQSTYQFRYTYPWLLPDKLGERVSFTFRRWLTMGKNIYLLETQEREGIYNGWEVGLNKPITDEWSVGLTLGSEKVDPTGTATFDPYVSDTIGLSLSYDTRDNWMNPSKGRYYVFGARRGWKKSIVDTNFMKYSVDLNQYVNIADRQVLAGHAGIGLGLGDVPPGEIYYAGGANTVRGYEPTEARTGKKRLLLNVEYRYTFNDMFQGVVFYDWGNAWDEGYPDLSQFITGRGFGLRLNTPMGPIRLDYGVGSNRQFSEGVMHFSIGQAF